jgi:hypothetical protein
MKATVNHAVQTLRAALGLEVSRSVWTARASAPLLHGDEFIAN